MLNISGIHEGFVLDHIQAGMSLQIYHDLKLDKLDCSVAIIKNAKSNKMGKKDIADEFYKRSQNYKNVYNPATSFMQPRDDEGVFIKDFKADDYTPHICESNGWQYFWSVQHDVDGLVNLVGGKNRFAEKLDSMFTYHPSEDDELLEDFCFAFAAAAAAA